MNLPEDLILLLQEKALQYSQPSYIQYDPVSVPHLFDKKEDIEIAGFLTATISWGQRITILKNAEKLTGMMEGGPHSFLMKAEDDDFERFIPFVHRTFNGFDTVFFLKALQRIYREDGGMQQYRNR